MGNNVLSAETGKFKGYALIRDKDGKPLIDNPATLPEEIKEMLTDDEYLTIYNKQRK